jgi:tRNA nucleotidyltransferase (CCA-adding enzyme)
VLIARDLIDRLFQAKQGAAALSVAEKLQAAGHECWFVGGAVRDLLLAKIPSEIDMAVSCRPEVTAALFPKSDSSAAALGTVVISEKGCIFELTTFRSDDAASDGRHPENVVFGSRGEDAVRRDATVNAMYWNPTDGTLFDPCHGEQDLRERLVRFIGKPEERITHDTLRILRMVRLRALLKGQYEPETYRALAKHAGLTSKLSGTRILEEIEKMLMLPSPEIALEDLWEIGVLSAVLPELHACKGVAQPKVYHKEGDVWEHLKKCSASFTDDHGADVRMAALFHDAGKPVTFSLTDRIHFDRHAEESARIAQTVFKRLQMPANRVKKIAWLISHHMMMGTFGELLDERKAHWYFHPWFQELLQLFWLDIAGSDPSDYSLYDSIIADYDAFLNAHPRPEKPLLSGDEVMEILGTGPGAPVGEALQALHDAQIRREVTSKVEARKFLAERKLSGPS